jgi:uncharacterized protein (TIGR00255 family)
LNLDNDVGAKAMSEIRSMTGFGEGRSEKPGDCEVRVVMRSINHRHSETQLRLPPEMAVHEAAIRRRIGRTPRRGKLDVSIRLTRESAAVELPMVNREQAGRLAAAAADLARELELPGELDLGTLMRLPGVIQQEAGARDFGEDELPLVFEALDQAFASLEATKRTEGEALARDLVQRIGGLEQGLGRLKAMAGEVAQLLLERLRQRLAELDATVELDQERLQQEVIFHADRGDVTEELVRLESHFTAFRQALAGGSPAGRRLEFLLQEIHREVNTTGSKVRSPELSALVIDMKSELEKVREQVLNLE